MGRRTSVLVPLGTFGLALALAAVVGPSPRALGIRPPGDSTAGKCKCQLKVLRIKCKADWKLNEFGPSKAPRVEKLKVKIDGSICQERPDTSAPNNVKTDAWVELWVGGIVLVDDKVEVETQYMYLVLKPQKVDVLTCPGKNYDYTWDADEETLRQAAIEKLELLKKIQKKDGEVLDAFLELDGAGHALEYGVASDSSCPGLFSILMDNCKDKVELRKKKGVVEGSSTHEKVCNSACEFGTP